MTEASPKPVLKLEVGKFYITRSGEIDQITGYHPSQDDMSKYSSEYFYYSEEGRMWDHGEHPQDLISEWGESILPRNNLPLQGLVLKTITITAAFTPEELDKANSLSDTAYQIAAASENIIAVHFCKDINRDKYAIENL